MFMVLALHANFLALPKPGTVELIETPGRFIIQHLVESLCIVAVNVFVLISGWFGIKPSIKGFLNLMFQIFFFWGILYYILMAFGYASFSFNQIIDGIAFSNLDQFIKAYLCLYILAPVLNSYTENTTLPQQGTVLLSFYLFSSTYGLFGGAQLYFVSGYGAISFIGLYLLARYVKNLKDSNERFSKFVKMPPINDFLIYFASALIITVLNVIVYYIGIKTDKVSGILYAYSNPLVILGSLYLLLAISKINFGYNSIINWLAASSFAAYLFHSIPQVRQVFCEHILFIDSNYTPSIIWILLYLIVVYFTSVIIDQFRIITWNVLKKYLS